MGSTRRSTEPPQTPDLMFDVTQEIDPALAEILRAHPEPSLGDNDSDDLDIEIAPPPHRTARR